MTETAFTDKVVVITGGAKGIVRWIAGGFMAKEQRLALIELPKQHNSGD